MKRVPVPSRGVEQTQLLAAVDSIEGVVDVEGDPPRHLGNDPQ